MNDFTAELTSSHEVKVSICYMLNELNQPVEEGQLYDIILDSGIINYFSYYEAMDDLLKNGSVSKKEIDGKSCIVLGEKGRMGADYFNEYVPYYFRKRILRAAFAFFAKLRRENETDITVAEIANGYEVRLELKDGSLELMKIALYAPDMEQAQALKEKILLNPARFYQNVINCALNNQEEQFDIK